jgi:hypothetical protein
MRTKTKKTIAVILLVSFFFLMLPKPTYAIWDDAMLAAIWTYSMNKMEKEIYTTLLAALKTAGIKLIVMQLNKMLGIGQGMGPVRNWQQFIYGSANTYAMMMTSSFFSSLSAGGTAYTNQYIINPAMRAAMSTSVQGPNIQSYVNEGRSDMIFQPGWAQNPKVAWQVAAQPQNDPGYLYLQGLSKQINAYNQQVGAKTAEGVAGAGFQSKSSGGTLGNPASGNITLPGSAQKDLLAKANGMPFDRISMAQDIPDVVVGIATGVLTTMLNEGIGMMGQAANKATGGALGPVIGTMAVGTSQIGNTLIKGGGASVQGAIQQGLK